VADLTGLSALGKRIISLNLPIRFFDSLLLQSTINL